MWFPQTALELTSAIAGGVLPHETTSIDYKQQPPVAAKNSEMAIDVAAMSTEGGVLIYGVAEDRKTKTLSPTPFSLVGFKERISQIVETRVREPIEFAVYELNLNPPDTDKGFAVVVVPASLRAPHQVEATGQYYGRQSGGNRVLGEAEVARLYERRQRAEDAALKSLDEAISHAPIDAVAGRGDLYLVVMPLLSDSGLRERALDGQGELPLVQDVHAARQAVRFRFPADPHFGDIISGGYPTDTIDGVAFLNPPIVRDGEEHNNDWVSRLELTDNGTLRYYHAAVAGRGWSEERFMINDTSVAQITAHFCLMAGTLLERGGYFGAVEVLIAVLGAGGAISSQWMDRSLSPRTGGMPVVPGHDYRHHVRVTSSKLKDDPVEVAQSLVSRLLRTVRPKGFPDPLTPPA